MYTIKAQMKRLLYRLKRQYGDRMYLYQVTSSSNNVKTGEIVMDYNVYKIKRGIPLPKQLMRKFAYDLTFLAANKNFQYGAYYDMGIRDYIIETKDLPRAVRDTVKVDLQWHLIYQHKRYNLKEVNSYADGLAMYIVAKQTVQQLPFEWHNKEVSAQIEFFEEVEGTV